MDFGTKIEKLRVRNSVIQEQLKKTNTQAQQMMQEAKRLEKEFVFNEVRIEQLQQLEKEYGGKKDIPK